MVLATPICLKSNTEDTYELSFKPATRENEFLTIVRWAYLSATTGDGHLTAPWGRLSIMKVDRDGNAIFVGYIEPLEPQVSLADLNLSRFCTVGSLDTVDTSSSSLLNISMGPGESLRFQVHDSCSTVEAVLASTVQIYVDGTYYQNAALPSSSSNP